MNQATKCEFLASKCAPHIESNRFHASMSLLWCLTFIGAAMINGLVFWADVNTARYTPKSDALVVAINLATAFMYFLCWRMRYRRLLLWRQVHKHLTLLAATSYLSASAIDHHLDQATAALDRIF